MFVVRRFQKLFQYNNELISEHIFIFTIKWYFSFAQPKINKKNTFFITKLLNLTLIIFVFHVTDYKGWSISLNLWNVLQC